MRVRKVLTLTILAGILAIGVSKSISGQVVSPRPLLYASQIYVTSGKNLETARRLPVRKPLDWGGQEKVSKFAIW